MLVSSEYPSNYSAFTFGVDKTTLFEILDPELAFDANGEPVIKAGRHSDDVLDTSGPILETADAATALVDLDKAPRPVLSTLTNNGGKHTFFDERFLLLGNAH